MNKSILKTVSKEQDVTLKNCSTVSAKIRYLHSLNWSTGDISRFLSAQGKQVRYQWVRNVLITPVKNQKA